MLASQNQAIKAACDLISGLRADMQHLNCYPVLKPVHYGNKANAIINTSVNRAKQHVKAQSKAMMIEELHL